MMFDLAASVGIFLFFYTGVVKDCRDKSVENSCKAAQCDVALPCKMVVSAFKQRSEEQKHSSMSVFQIQTCYQRHVWGSVLLSARW